jgi:hypothetical protein
MGMIPTNEMVRPFSMGNGTPNQFNSQSQEDTFQSELFLYVILKHILSEDYL